MPFHSIPNRGDESPEAASANAGGYVVVWTLAGIIGARVAAIPGGGWRLRAVLSDPPGPGIEHRWQYQSGFPRIFHRAGHKKHRTSPGRPVCLCFRTSGHERPSRKAGTTPEIQAFVPSAPQKGCPETEEIPQKRHARGRRAFWINNHLWIPAFHHELDTVAGMTVNGDFWTPPAVRYCRMM